ncbi:hypothetical protein Tco_0482080 [Tanacetum coccineum]
MSTLLELYSIEKSNDLKDMMVVLFESENEKDLMTANSMTIKAEYLATRIRERDLLIGELDNCLGSITAYESSKLLREMNDADLPKARFGEVSFSCYSKGDMKFRDRVFPHMVGLTITSLDLLGVIEDEEYFSKLCDAVAIRVYLLLCLEVIFMGRLLVTGFDDILMRLVDSLESWNAFPWGEHIWMHLNDEIMNVVSNHKSGHLEGLHKSPKYVPTYTLSGFVWAFKDSNPIFDLRPTLAEYKSEWWTDTNDFLQVYVPRTPIRKPDIFDAYLQKVFAGRKHNRLCRLISMPNTNVPRRNISSVKDSIIKELNSCIFKLEDIIQVLGQERNGDVVEKLQFRTPLDADTQEEFDKTEDYLVEEEFIRRLEEEERLLLEEERLNEEEIRVRLEEHKQLRLEEYRALKVKKKWEEDYKKRSYAFMNFDHMKQAMARCAPKKRSYPVAVRTYSWFKVCNKFDKKKESFGLVDRDMTEFLKNVKPWVEVYILINEPGQHWCLAEFDILSGVVSFNDSGDSYDLECRDWYIRTRDCLQVRLPEVLELLNVLDKKGIDKSCPYLSGTDGSNL